jgi:hypothetical protein
MIDDSARQNLIATLYVNQPLNLPPLTAQAAFDAVRCGCALPRAPDTWVIETARGELQVVGTGLVIHQARLWALRRASGRLIPRGRLGAMAIEVEVTPWSQLRCEVGIRPGGWMAPATEGWRQRRYLALAIEAAEELALRLEAIVEDWMVEQLAGPAADLARLA